MILLCLSVRVVHVHILADKAEDPSNGHRVYRHNSVPNKVMSVYRRRNFPLRVQRRAHTPFSHTYTRFINTREVTAPRWQCKSSITKHNCRANCSSNVTYLHGNLMDYEIMQTLCFLQRARGRFGKVVEHLSHSFAFKLLIGPLQENSNYSRKQRRWRSGEIDTTKEKWDDEDTEMVRHINPHVSCTVDNNYRNGHEEKSEKQREKQPFSRNPALPPKCFIHSSNHKWLQQLSDLTLEPAVKSNYLTFHSYSFLGLVTANIDVLYSGI